MQAVGASYIADCARMTLDAVPQTGVDLTNVKMSMNPFCEVGAYQEATQSTQRPES